MDSPAGKIKISVFGPTDHTYSIDRYAHALTRSFPPTVEATLVQFPTSGGLVRKQIDRFWGYTRFAASQQGDFNVVITEAYAYLLKVLPGRNTICVCHDMHGLTYTGPRTAQYRFYYLRYRWALRFLTQAKFVVTVSHNTKADLLKFCPFLSEDKVVPVHNGLEDHWRQDAPTALRERLRHSYGIGQRRIILHVGNDVWYKNTARLISAFARLTMPDLVLVHVGNLTPESQALIRELNVGDRIVQMTNLSDDELAALYQIAEMHVFPSTSEGFGWPPLEAMAGGCPTICSNIGSLKEICGDATIFVNPVDICDIAKAMARVLEEKDLRDTLIARGYAQSAKFSWKSTADTFLELFQRG
jgi:glycosyltransferase involved in cell wall biosynthesis